MQLASLSFPSHPDLLGLIPDASPVKQHEARPTPGRRAVPLVQIRDPFHRRRQQFVVTRKAFTLGISPV
jgi:hypothetical protein